MCTPRVYQCFYFKFLAIFCFHVCLYIQFPLFPTILVVWNNIFVLTVYMRDLLYCVYLRSSLKPCSFFLNLLFLHQLCFFTVLGYMPFFVTLETFPYFSFFLLRLAFLCYVSILVAVEVLWLSILEVVVGLSNIHGLFLLSIGYSYAHFVVVSFFCGLVSLFN